PSRPTSPSQSPHGRHTSRKKPPTSWASVPSNTPIQLDLIKLEQWVAKVERGKLRLERGANRWDRGVPSPRSRSARGEKVRPRPSLRKRGEWDAPACALSISIAELSLFNRLRRLFHRAPLR